MLLTSVRMNNYSSIYIVSKNRTKVDNLEVYAVWLGNMMQIILLNVFIAVVTTGISHNPYFVIADMATLESVILFFVTLILADTIYYTAHKKFLMLSGENEVR